ncbi:MAG: helix-turn-helix domain-containing protein [bacterium]
MPRDLLTPQQLADVLGVKLSTIYYWSHTRYIPTVKMGRLLRFRRSSIERWLEKREKPPVNRKQLASSAMKSNSATLK